VETEETLGMDRVEQAFRPAVKMPENAALAAEVVRDDPRCHPRLLSYARNWHRLFRVAPSPQIPQWLKPDL
jgi:hypothetical protein